MPLRRRPLLLALLPLAACSAEPEPAAPEEPPTLEFAAPEPGTEAVDRTHPVYAMASWGSGPQELAPEEVEHETFDFQTHSPLEFLEHLVELQQSAQETAPEAVFAPGVTLWSTHRGWVRDEDVDALLALLEDDTPCASVQSSLCSFLPMEPSSVGREAAFLLQGLIDEQRGEMYGGYPPGLSSMGSFDPDAEALWEHFRGGERDLRTLNLEPGAQPPSGGR